MSEYQYDGYLKRIEEKEASFTVLEEYWAVDRGRRTGREIEQPHSVFIPTLECGVSRLSGTVPVLCGLSFSNFSLYRHSNKRSLKDPLK